MRHWRISRLRFRDPGNDPHRRRRPFSPWHHTRWAGLVQEVLHAA